MRKYCPECHEEMGVIKRGVDGVLLWGCIDVYHCGYTQTDEIEQMIDGMDNVCRRNIKRRDNINKVCYEMLEIEVDKEYIANELKLTTDVVERIYKELKENKQKAI